VTMRSIFLLFVLFASAQADTLILRNGARVTGRWWASDADVINFLVNGRLEQYPRPEVAEVVFGAGPDADSAPAAPAPAPPAAAPASSAGSAAPAARAPGQIGVVYFQDGSGNLLPLEQTVAVEHRAPTAPGGRPGPYWDMPGARSPFRLKSNSQMLFVVELPGGVAPNTFQLYLLETRGNARRTKSSNGATMTIPLSMRKVAGNTYIFAPVGGLAPGEYSFSPPNSNDAYCFGIDSPTPDARQ
jgi:hypothetical protein